jgi:serine/threonine protein phosphatase 1
LNWLKDEREDSNWLRHGGLSTIESYQNVSEVEKLKHINFFETLKNYHVDSENRLFIHAGYTSMHGPEHEFSESYYSWDRTLWEMALTMDSRIKKDLMKSILGIHQLSTMMKQLL